MSGIGDKAKDLLNSDKGEQATDGALGKAGDAIDQKTGGTHSDQISKAEHAADAKIGE